MSDPTTKSLDGLNVEKSVEKLKSLIASGVPLAEVLAIARADPRTTIKEWADTLETAAKAAGNVPGKPAGVYTNAWASQQLAKGNAVRNGSMAPNDGLVMSGGHVVHVVNGEVRADLVYAPTPQNANRSDWQTLPGDFGVGPDAAKPAPKSGACLRFFAHHGCPRSFEPVPGHYEKVLGADGREIQTFVPGTTVVSLKFGGDKRVRVIDVPALSCCKRGQFRVKPEEVSRLIMESPFRQKDALFEMKPVAAGVAGLRIQVPLIQTESEYEELRKEEAAFAVDVQAKGKAFQEQQLAKRGKRGEAIQVAASAPTV